MSRLYLSGLTDAIKAERTARGHRYARATIYWGSREDSRLAVEVKVTWADDIGKPIVHVDVGPGVVKA